MQLEQLQQGLHYAFFTDGYRRVFWYDPPGHFTDALDELALDGVQILNMAGQSTFGVKLRLELDEPETPTLLYFPYAEPAPEDDWLLDIKLYSGRFYADQLSMIFNELGLTRHVLREHLAKRQAFLGSRKRIEALKRLVTPEMDEEALDLAMCAVVVGAPASDVATLLFHLADEAVAEAVGLEGNPSSLDEMTKYALVPSLVKALQLEVGYPATQAELIGDEALHFGQLMLRLLTTGYCESLSEIPDWAQSHAIASVNARATSRALLSRWRDSSRFFPAFDEISGWVAEALRIEDKIRDVPLERLANVATFEVVEKQIIVDLCQAIPQADVRDLAMFRGIIAERLDGYWASRHKNDERRVRYRQLYAALSAAIDLFALRQQHLNGFYYESVEALYHAYCNDLYRFDTAYRHYAVASDNTSVELLKKLDEAVERCYDEWFLGQLTRNWSERIDAEGRLHDWKLPRIPNQQHFFRDVVRSHLDAHGNKRLVVIISDAFRYEAAEELRERINAKRYSEATLASQLGVVPSYTTLGMASLLPHHELSYQPGCDNVLVDGKSSQGTDNRSQRLSAAVGGQAMAVTAETVRGWSREQGREAIKGVQLMYVYHNVVDARGDTASTENETFAAVEDAIEELDTLTRKILMHLNTSTVLVTADHGFLFQRGKLDATDRTHLTEKPAGAFKSKKRYVLGTNLPDNASVWHGHTRKTAGTACDTEFWIPKGAHRFHFVGGARFVHGGIMPQEIAVPVLTVKQLRGDKAEKRTRRKVDVISPKASLKMVNNIQRFELMQTEAVSEKLKPITLAVTIINEDNAPVSSEETMTFDSASDNMNERVKSLRLSLSGTDFDRKRDYFLVLRDKDLGTELERYRVVIDLAFTDDFF
ncbi:BREX-1 system phosphatase PglZ type A [Halomonas vilamensis]|uniref:BREX-1 system phosphatase PglZ type A n=1 Tax=Vreelandella vilamensis TaxID=531309 RepID=A0ABU1H3G7_9GAMM|nr:BREX-1 system phosphatase PglZ type A [Halomonas vilamensis]MDR5898846.1 BREX-1 system phosphatase PglZ type A [Halomonas vilamensis]